MNEDVMAQEVKLYKAALCARWIDLCSQISAVQDLRDAIDLALHELDIGYAAVQSGGNPDHNGIVFEEQVQTAREILNDALRIDEA